MSDLSELQSASSTKIAGSDPTGIETNFAAVDSNQHLNTVTGDLAVSGTLVALNATVAVNTQGRGTVAVKISGVFSQVYQFQGFDGVNWVPIPGTFLADPAFNGTPLFACESTVVGAWTVGVGGYQQFRIQTISFTSGTITVQLNSSREPNLSTILNSIAYNTGAAKADTIAVGNITALNGFVNVYAQGACTVSAVIAGTFVATLIAEGLLADGTTWAQLPIYIILPALPYNAVASVAAPTNVLITSGGYTNIRIRASAYTSGTVLVSLDGAVAQQTVFSAQLGTWIVYAVPGDGTKPTYSAGITGLVASAMVPTDIFTITGSATKTIRITRISLTATQTTASQRDVLLIKRSTANTGGTSVAVAATSHDSSNPTATATILAYTTNPTLGTAVGTPIRTRKVFVATTGTNSDEFIVDFGTRPAQAAVLRGVTQVLAVNLNGVISAGSLFDINIEWTEE